jgi:long-chain fatty acid transport protein
MLAKQLPVRALPFVIATLFSGYAGAAGFQLWEQNASGLGNAFAGSAAVAEDASTIFFNPAGMVHLPASKRHVAASLDFVKPGVEFSNSNSTPPLGIAPGGGNGGDAGDWAIVPAGYLAWPLSDRLSVGVGLSAPFGLATEYDDTWVGRFHAVKSEIETINLNPSIAFKVNDMLSLGFGVNYQTIDAELSNKTNYFGAVVQGLVARGLSPAAAAAAAGAALPTQGSREGLATINGDDDAWGWNIGVMLQLSPSTRLGIAYRSSIEYDIEGSVSFQNRPAALAAALPDGSIKVNIEMPDMATLSVYQKLSDQWELMGDLSWTGWSNIPSLDIFRSNGTLLTKEVLNWDDTWRVAFGGAYKYSDQWKAKFGLAYDESPVSDQFRLARLPDNDRIWLSLGGQYKPTKDSALDFGYTYIFVDDPSISTDPANAAAKGILRGQYDNDVNLLGVQYSMSF